MFHKHITKSNTNTALNISMDISHVELYRLKELFREWLYLSTWANMSDVYAFNRDNLYIKPCPRCKEHAHISTVIYTSTEDIPFPHIYIGCTSCRVKVIIPQEIDTIQKLASFWNKLY